MSDFKYTPDKEQKVHAPGAIGLICKPYQSHENGLPEWCKNAADAYARENAPPERRIIVILFSDRKSHGRPAIGCLDFIGTTDDRIQKYFSHWAAPDAAKQDSGFDVQGGHGNGGKCYMTQMFEDYALFHTVRDGRGCKYGVPGGETRFGYVPNGRNFRVKDKQKELGEALAEMGVQTVSLPEAALESLNKGDGFTLVKGVGPKYYKTKIRARHLIAQIRDHPQMSVTQEYCKVFALYNGKLLKDCNPLQHSEIDPIPGAESPRIIDIPEKLKDPLDGAKCSTTQKGTFACGKLTLHTSRVSMRWKKKYRHSINYKSLGGFVGYKSVPDFEVRSSYQDQIYGECELDALQDFVQNDRRHLAEAPLTRAVENFIAQQIEAYAREFEKQDKRTYTKQERSELSRMNEVLNRWKDQFIKDFVQGAFGPTGGGPDPGRRLPAGKPARIEVIASYSRLGIGVAIRPQVRFFNLHDKQVRPVPYRWVSEDTNVAMVDDDLMVINSFSPGKTSIWAETTDGQLKSNRFPLEVVHIWSVKIEPTQITVPMGSRAKLKAICKLSDEEFADDVALIWTENDTSIARVSTSGMVFGAAEGSTEIIAGDDKVSCDSPSVVKVTESEGSGQGKGIGGKGSGKRTGRGYPLVLISGEVDPDPDTGDYLTLTPDYPPVYQRPKDSDRNIWWINSAAPLAKLYLDREMGYGYDQHEWRMYYIERLIEIMAEIAMIYDPDVREAMTVREYVLYRADKLTEIHSAAANDLDKFIKDGILPKV